MRDDLNLLAKGVIATAALGSLLVAGAAILGAAVLVFRLIIGV